MAAIAFALPNSPLHCTVYEGVPISETLDMNESSFYVDGPRRNEARQKPTESVIQYTSRIGSDLFAYDHSTESHSITCQLPLNCITPTIARLSPNEVHLDSWQKTYPEQWTCEDVLNLIYFIAMQSSDIEFSNFYGEKFQNVNGGELISMTEEQFVLRDPKYGKMLYGCTRDLLLQSQFHPPEDLPMDVKQEKPDTTTSAIKTEIPVSVEEMTFDEPGEPSSLKEQDFMANFVDIFGVKYDIDPAADFPLVIPSTRISGANGKSHAPTNEIRYQIPQSYQQPHHISSQLQQQQQHLQSLHHHHHHHLQQLPIFPDSICMKAESCQPRDIDDVSWLTDVKPCHRNPDVTTMDKIKCVAFSDGESSSGGSSGGSPGIGSTITTISVPHDDIIIGRMANGGKGGNHLWEFLCQQLRRSESIPTNDRIIQWECREDGVFRIIDSKEISIQWGIFKGNYKMTYEKLSRALRWCRANGFLATLPKNGSFPKKLCFRFGPKATNWRDFL